MSVKVRLRAVDERGTPLGGAQVRTGDELVATTDESGVATVDIDTGFDSVTVSHSMPAEAQLVFSFGEGSSGVFERTAILRRGAPLSGTVVAPDGSPLAAALVEVWTETGTRFVEADDAGAWSVPAMQAGAYEARASAEGYALGRAVAGTHDGKTEQRGVILRVGTGARLHGRVRNPTGPIAGAHVYTEMQPGTDSVATTDSDGRFQIVGLGPGRHLVSVDSWSSTVVMAGDDSELEIDIELPPEQSASAHSAEDASDRASPQVPQPTATLTGRVLRDGVPVTEFGIVRKGFARYHWIARAIIHAPDGRFTLTGLRETSCSVHVLALGTGWAATPTIELQPGSTHDLGDIELSPGLRVSGTVHDTDGAPVEHARVEIGGPTRDEEPLIDAVDGNFATVTGSDGAFLFDGVHAREHVRVSASHPKHGASLEHPLSGTDETIRLVLVPTGSIDGEVQPNGAMHSAVIVRPDAPDNPSHFARVRPSGVFAVENVVPGEYTIEFVQRPGWPRREARATVLAGQRTRVRLPPP